MLDYIVPLQGAARLRLLAEAQRVINEPAKESRSEQQQLSDATAAAEPDAVDSGEIVRDDSVSRAKDGSGSGGSLAEVDNSDKRRKRAVQRAKRIVHCSIARHIELIRYYPPLYCTVLYRITLHCTIAML